MYAWGDNTFGQLGDHSYNPSSNPKAITIREDVISISCGKSHSLALTVCGRVYVWGNNCYGQLGIDKPEFRMRPNSNRPELIPGLEKIFFTKALCGPNHSLLLSSDGCVYAFGDNTCGQIGNGAVGNQFSPFKVKEDIRFKDIITYKENDISIAVSTDDKFYVWGLAKNRRFTTPKEITDCAGQSVFDVYAIYAKKNVTFKTIVINDELQSWERIDKNVNNLGNNITFSQLNDENESIFSETEDSMINPLMNERKMSVQSTNSAKFTATERKADNQRSAKSLENILDIKLFLKNPAIIEDNIRKNIRLLYVWGIYGSKVIFATNDDKVYAFGHNRDGSLGLGTIEENILMPRHNPHLSGKRLVQIRNGYEHCIGFTANGQCYGWGHNNFGQLGVGNTQNSNKPVLIEELSDMKVVQVACGAHHSMALTSEGELFSWGHNTFAQLGDRTYNSRSTPTQVLINEKVISISCGCYHSIALSESGRVYIWGNNTNGQLGRNPERDVRKTRLKPMSNRPKPIEGLENILFKKAVCGPNHSLLLTTDGFVYSFGLNTDGQIGNGSVEPQFTPFRVNKGLKIKDVITYWENDMSIAVGVDDKLYVWGLALDKKIVRPKEVHNSCGKSYFDIYAKLAKNKVTFKTVLVNEDEYHNPLKLNINPLNPPLVETQSQSPTSPPFVYKEENFGQMFPQLPNSAVGTNSSALPHQDLNRMSRVNDYVMRAEEQNIVSYNGSDDENDDIFSETENSLIDQQNNDTNHTNILSLSSNVNQNSTPEPNSELITGNVFLSRLRKSFNNPNNYDLRIKSEDKVIYCHKTILEIRNEKFWDILRGNKGNIDEIQINGDSYTTFYAFLQYIYGLEPKIDDQIVIELQRMSNIFKEPVLEDMCAQHIYKAQNTPNLMNICSLYEKAVNNGLKDLEKSCIEFAANNWKAIFKSDAFQSMNESLSKRLMLSIV